MSNPALQLVQKLWNYCNILRDDGLSFRLRKTSARQDGDYVEQLTFLLFLKMADEQSRPPFNPPSPSGYGGTGPPSGSGYGATGPPSPGYGATGKPSAVPKEFAWPSLLARDGRCRHQHLHC